MRESFRGELVSLQEQLQRMCAQAAHAMRRAAQAALTSDAALAAEVVAADAELDQARDHCDETAQRLLALQAPVAGDLRLVMTAVHCADKIERMGDLAAHVADGVRVSPSHPVVPDELRPAFTELGEIAAGMADRLVELIRDPGQGGFAELDATDQTVDARHAEILDRITADDWPYGVPCATSLALLARYYERFADQAVSIAKRLDFAVTGITAA